MKILMCILFTFIGFAGVGDSAGGSSKSWNELMKNQNRKYYFEVPSYVFDNGMTLSVTKLCDEGNTVRSIQKYGVYETIVKRNGNESVRIGTEYARRLINQGLDGRVVSLEGEIEVRQVRSFGNNKNGFEYKPGKFLFNKKYEVQKCENLDQEN